MKIIQIQKQSLIEYPGKISAVIFLAGCPLRCPWCYVPQLVLPERIQKLPEIPQEKVLAFLEERRGFLEGVAISGGEATINPKLPDFVKKIKKMGYEIELETNGTNPEMLEYLIKNKLIDYAAMDLKQRFVFEKWYKVTGEVLTREIFEKIKRSVGIILKNRIDYQFRTTLVKEFHKKEDIVEIAKEVRRAKIYYLQNYEKTEETVSGKQFTPFKEEEILDIARAAQRYANVKVRRYL